MTFLHSEGWPLVIAGSALLLDQTSKAAALRNFEVAPRQLAPGVRLILIRNERGGVLGISKGWAASVTLAVVTGILIFIWTAAPITTSRGAGLGLMIGGAAGNLVDRFARGTVIDFIGIWRWPTFNLADAALCVGFAVNVASFL